MSRAGLVPVLSLAERAGLLALARRHVSVGGPCGANAEVKIGCLVAGMAAGADSIDDMDVLRRGAMAEVFAGLRAPSTVGSFLRSFTWRNVLQLGKVSRELLTELAALRRCCPASTGSALVASPGSPAGGAGDRLPRGLLLSAAIIYQRNKKVPASAVDATCTGTLLVFHASGMFKTRTLNSIQY